MRQREFDLKWLVVSVILIIIWLILFNVDRLRVYEYNQKPWFCIPININRDRISNTYYGVFYKTIVETNSSGEVIDGYITYWFDDVD